jgi:uncharacterized damage-inducible protein DinB
MAKTLEPMTAELQQEAAITKRVFARIPADKLTWQPHPKSMTLGQLAIHIAMIPGIMTQLAQLSEFDVSNANFTPPQPNGMDEVNAAFDAGVHAAASYFAEISDADTMANWQLSAGGKELFTIPRVVMLRSIMLNHLYHHRGQMSVYLRLLDVAVPIIYGRSADETPFDVV